MKQTAVEWFEAQVGHNSLMALKEFNEIFEKAKEMEREQVIEQVIDAINQNNMKQTAVEWLALYIKGITSLNCDEVIEQAKAMEKKQSHSEYMRGWKDGLTKQQDK
jgi:hypothetical protein